MRNHTDQSLASARKLRKEMTLPELLIWRELRKRPGDLKFRRQHPIGPFVADFFCNATMLVIEVDGEAHNMGDRPKRDERRDAWLSGQGYRVLRIPARDVLADLNAAIEYIVLEAAPLRPASPATSPGGGGVVAFAAALIIALLPAQSEAKTGTGWSRASDLSVYQAMDEFGDIAREQEVLCRGRGPARVAVRWSNRFAAREARVAAALTERYGAGAVRQARTLQGERQPCAPFFDRSWARNHGRLLDLLETRLFAPSLRTRG